MNVLSQAHLLDWLTLHLTPDLGGGSMIRLLNHFGEPARVLAASSKALSQVPGLRPKTVAALAGIKKNNGMEKAARELDRIYENGIILLTWNDDRYPELLRAIHSPPMVLYVKGCIESLQTPAVGIVGSRAATDYGRGIARNFARELTRFGYTIISGLALGIDAEAHRGAIDAGGRTVGVLGCGLDIAYPRENSRLYHEIPETGALVSEYPLGTRPDSFRFPARNRIISGLSQGVVVVEASKHSGSLITAQHALEQGREVFAIPGRVDSIKSAGAHALVQQGAKLVQTIDDIIEELPPPTAGGPAVSGGMTGPGAEGFGSVSLTSDEERLLSFLDVYPKDIDEIARTASLLPQRASELLLLLELKGVIKALPGKCYQRNSGKKAEG